MTWHWISEQNYSGEIPFIEPDKDCPHFTSSVWSQAHDWPKKWASSLDENLCYPSVLLFQSRHAWLSYFMLSVCQRERGHEDGRLNAVQPPVGTVIITLSGGHKSSMPHLCQVSWHWLSNEGCLSLTMFTIDHHVTVSQQAERYECLLLHLNCTALTHSHSSSDCFLISAAIHSEHDFWTILYFRLSVHPHALAD